MTGQMLALDGGQHLAWETPDVVGIANEHHPLEQGTAAG